MNPAAPVAPTPCKRGCPKDQRTTHSNEQISRPQQINNANLAGKQKGERERERARGQTRKIERERDRETERQRDRESALKRER